MNLPNPDSSHEQKVVPPPLPIDHPFPNTPSYPVIDIKDNWGSPRQSLLKRLLVGTFLMIEWLFGMVSMVCALAILAAIPIIQFLSLGYMLEASARVAKSGRIRDGFIGIRTASHLGGAVFAVWFLLLPIRYLSNVAYSAQIINPDGTSAAKLRFWVLLMTILAGLHIVFALARGGRLRHFFWPLNFITIYRQVKAGGSYSKARDATWDFINELRLPYYFWLGLRGFLAAFFWLVLPATLLALGQMRNPFSPVVGFSGALLLAVVALHLPLLQAQMAIKNRFGAAFDWREARRAFNLAPWACSFALVITLIFALPLYLLKIEVIPQEALWLPTLLFIIFIFPSRIATGWALYRTRIRESPRHWFFRWTGRVPLLPTTVVYLLFVFFSQYTNWNGIASLYEQHAFLLPVPFLGL